MSMPAMASDRFELEVDLLLEAIFLRYHYDFRGYAIASVRRRIQAALASMRLSSVSELQGAILSDARAFTRLLHHLTVHVSDLFRDPPFWKTFRARIVPELATYPSPRIWVAGASTGEEVYSVAIVLAEEGLLERSFIYATDIATEALAKARDGVYPLERFITFAENHRQSGGRVPLTRWCAAGSDHVKLDRGLRDRVVFSDHSLATDSVFAEVQAVLCRNVLIYFDETLQDRALGLFADALPRRGFLGLGATESLTRSSKRGAFEPFAPETKWYRRKAGA
jgi:chemotaxis protein methyltransferase CheR